MKACKDIIIAIHGIGSQSRNATVRSVATRFARSLALASRDSTPLSPQPLGYFHTDIQGAVKVTPADWFDDKTTHALAEIGFCEVFWADIPEKVAQEKRTLEETKAWARTVVSRANAVFSKGWKKLSEAQRLACRQPDFGQAGEVLEEVIDTVQVLENLCYLAEKAGVMKINIGDVLEDYLGDVQLMTEFKFHRHEIIGRFHRALEQIHREHPTARLHIVAHSEGTVVSFLGLLHAMSGQRVFPGDEKCGPLIASVPEPPPWLRQVHGYMTFGSPIDKHLLLWPELFREFEKSDTQESKLAHSRPMFTARAEQQRLKDPDAVPDRGIEWRNYYDLGDPVGFELDTARHWLGEQSFSPFRFEAGHDIGFARYLMPGAAHTGYWEDPVVFEHFVRDVVRPSKDYEPEIPKSRFSVQVFSPLIPFALSFFVLFAGTWIFYRTVSQHLAPPSDPLQDYIRYMTLGTPPREGPSGWHLMVNSLMVTLLVAGTTLLSRFPRLIREWKWLGWGILSFLIGALAYRVGINAESAASIGSLISATVNWGIEPADGIILVALLVGLAGLMAVPKVGWMQRTWHRVRKTMPAESSAPRQRHAPTRRSRSLLKGMRPLILAGAVAIGALVGYQVYQQKMHPTPLTNIERDAARQAFAGTNSLVGLSTSSPIWIKANHRLVETERLIQPHPPVWPLVVSGLVFLYLWWLSGLLFDLAFVWQKYIRDSALLRRFRACVRPGSPAQSGSENSDS